jgi:hypothetical protein
MSLFSFSALDPSFDNILTTILTIGGEIEIRISLNVMSSIWRSPEIQQQISYYHKSSTIFE